MLEYNFLAKGFSTSYFEEFSLERYLSYLLEIFSARRLAYSTCRLLRLEELFWDWLELKEPTFNPSKSFSFNDILLGI